MRIAVAAIGLLLLAAPGTARATGGMECRPVSGTGPVLRLVIGHGTAPAILSAQLTDGRTLRSIGNVRNGTGGLAIGQGWIDQRHLWLDLLDPNFSRYEGQLRATFQPRQRGRPAVGTFVREGRTYRMRCVEA